MKKFILLILLFCSIAWVNGQAPDTPEPAKLPVQVPSQNPPAPAKTDPRASIPPIDTTKAAIEKKTKDSLAALKTICDSCAKKASDTFTNKIHKPGALEDPVGSWLLVFLPLILFGTIITVLFSKLGKFSLQEALTENEYVKKTIKNPEYTLAAATTLAGTNAFASLNAILPPTIDITDISNNALTSSGIIDAQIKDKTTKLGLQIIADKAENAQEQLLINALPAGPAQIGRQAILQTKIASDKAKNDKTQSEIDTLITKASELPTTPRASSSRFIALVTSLLTLIIAVCLCSFFIYFYIATGTPPDISKFSSVLLALGIGVLPYAFNKVATAITNKPTINE